MLERFITFYTAVAKKLKPFMWLFLLLILLSGYFGYFTDSELKDTARYTLGLTLMLAAFTNVYTAASSDIGQTTHQDFPVWYQYFIAIFFPLSLIFFLSLTLLASYAWIAGS